MNATCSDSKEISKEVMGQAECVRIRRLTLTDFRSYDQMTLTLDGRSVALTGENGAGKTNILEALSLLGPGRGLRGARLTELPRLGGAGGWAVAARIDDGNDDDRAIGVGATTQAPERRACRMDGQSASGPTAFTDIVRFLWLTPAQDRLFVEGASDRRRFFDRMVATHDRAFSSMSSGYEQAMRQRQRLLDTGSRDIKWLEALECQMAENGVAIADARRHMAQTLMSHEVAGTDGLFPAADIALEGELEAALDSRVAGDVEDEFIERLAYQRSRDREAGRALHGPHKTDLVVGHRPKARPARLCSTGEQKALLIGLVLANAQALSQALSQAQGVPIRKAANAIEGHDGVDRTARLILLLDEIAAHLDQERRARLFDILDGLGFQVFMTGTDQSLFSAWSERAQHLTVSDGRITPANAM